MAKYSKVRSLVTGNPAMDNFIREVRNSLGELYGETGIKPETSRVVEWDENHALAFSLSNKDGTTIIRNEGSAGNSHYLTLAGSITPRLGFPSPVGDAIEFAAESSGSTSYATGLGDYSLKANDYSVECIVFTHQTDQLGSSNSSVLFQKNGSIALTWPDGGTPPYYASPRYYWWSSSSINTFYAPNPVCVPIAQWSHIMITSSSTVGKRSYVDGRVVATSSSTTNTDTNANAWFIGAPDSASTYRYRGAMARWAYSTTVRPQSYAKLVTAKLNGWV